MKQTSQPTSRLSLMTQIPPRPSGIRLGTPAATARGMGESEMNQLADWMIRALKAADDKDALAEIKGEVHALCEQFPVPGFDS